MLSKIKLRTKLLLLTLVPVLGLGTTLVVSLFMQSNLINQNVMPSVDLITQTQLSKELEALVDTQISLVSTEFGLSAEETDDDADFEEEEEEDTDEEKTTESKDTEENDDSEEDDDEKEKLEAIKAYLVKQSDNIRYHGGEGYFFIYDTEGVQINNPTIPDDNGENKLELSDKDGVFIVQELVDAAKDGGGVVHYYWGDEGEEIHKASYARIVPGTNFVVGTGIAVTDVEMAKMEVDEVCSDSLSNLINTVIVIGIIVVALIIIMLVLITRNMTVPMNLVRDEMKRVADGNIIFSDDDWNRHGKVFDNRRDEMGDLGESSKTMITNLVEVIDQIQLASNQVSSSSENLSSVSTNLEGELEDMETQSQSVSVTTEQMSQNISSMASAAEEMSANAHLVSGAAGQLNESMSHVTQVISDMGQSITHIAQEAHQAEGVSKNATELSMNASEVMGRLGTAAEEVGNVTDLIKRIAEQTNLLALNATIEAASAGEAGKGFAVVANEVKELAGQSAKAADEIASQISGIQTSTTEAVDVIDHINTIIAEIGESISAITAAVEQQVQGAAEITEHVSSAGDGVRSIANSIDEVAVGTNDVSLNSGEAAKGSGDVASRIGSLHSSVITSKKGASDVKETAEMLAMMSSQLQNLVGRFSQ